MNEAAGVVHGRPTDATQSRSTTPKTPTQTTLSAIAAKKARDLWRTSPRPQTWQRRYARSAGSS